jgi:hypothetical protein
MKSQPDQINEKNKKPWTPENFVPAFTAALTRSAWDKSFRERLIRSADEAKKAVGEEGDIEIPPEMVIVFHEHVSNDNYQVLHLPPFNPQGKESYEYEEHLDCCYNRFLIPRDGKFQNLRVNSAATGKSLPPDTGQKKAWTPDNAAAAFSQALTEAAHNGAFRKRLTDSIGSAKQAVSEIANIEIPKEVVIVFHENKYNDNYHVFYLPDFKEAKPDEPHETHEYRKHFQAAYHVW